MRIFIAKSEDERSENQLANLWIKVYTRVSVVVDLVDSNDAAFTAHKLLSSYFSANLSHRSLPFFFRTDYMDCPDRLLFTVTSERIYFYLLVFLFYTFSCRFRAVD